jgi:hypothetical protein
MQFLIASVIVVAGTALAAALKRCFAPSPLGRAIIGASAYLLVGALVGLVILSQDTAANIASVKFVLAISASAVAGLLVAGGIWLVISILRACGCVGLASHRTPRVSTSGKR